jgi:hypothetical protein
LEELEAAEVSVFVAAEEVLEVACGVTEDRVVEIELVDVAEVVESIVVDVDSVFDHVCQLRFIGLRPGHPQSCIKMQRRAK